MDQEPTKEGHISFSIPSIETPCSTYYKVLGDLDCGAPPVVMLHGGPGGGHEYLLPFASLWSRYGLPVILYDQIGCGASTHLPQTAGDKSFWTVDLFVAELNNLIDHLQIRNGPGFHLFGQSWGGVLAVEFAISRPIGLRRLVLASATASFESCVRAARLLRSQLPPEAEATLMTAEQTGDWTTAAAEEVQGMLSTKHVCRANPFPPLLLKAMKTLTEDTTVYRTMYVSRLHIITVLSSSQLAQLYVTVLSSLHHSSLTSTSSQSLHVYKSDSFRFGKTWLAPDGSMSGWTSIPRLPKITATTLVYNGEFDTSHDVTTVPFFELIPRVRWITFANAGHMCHLESAELLEKILSIVGDFLVQA